MIVAVAVIVVVVVVVVIIIDIDNDVAAVAVIVPSLRGRKSPTRATVNENSTTEKWERERDGEFVEFEIQRRQNRRWRPAVKRRLL